jgi:hypothetical protein
MQQLKYFQDTQLITHIYSMNKHLTNYLFIGSLLGLALRAHAQVTFRVGPTVGLNVTTARFAPNEQLLNQGVTITTNTSYRMHGTQSNVQSIDGTIPAPYEYTSQLNYLTVPLNFT